MFKRNKMMQAQIDGHTYKVQYMYQKEAGLHVVALHCPCNPVMHGWEFAVPTYSLEELNNQEEE